VDPAKILITGANGQLGKALKGLYPAAKGTNSTELDITKNDVDGAETVSGRIAAWLVNAAGVANLTQVALKKDLTLVHISTDYIFDGMRSPHAEEEPFTPLSSYGASKAAGDIAAMMAPKHYILRSSWIVGEGKNFAGTMLRLGKQGISPKVVDDQIGRPTFTAEMARAIDHLLQKQPPFGVYNMTNEGDPVSWADFASEIFKQAGLNVAVASTSTQDYFADKPDSAKRPPNSLFDLTKLESTGFTPRDWREDLNEYIKKEMERP
jgi:dTDP-4-dehydrorhamnose reductase